MKIVRSKGTSFTTPATIDEVKRLGRGLVSKGEESEGPVSPEHLPKAIVEDGTLRIRQIISILDKVIRKARSLRNFEEQAYCDRVHLAEALWEKAIENQPALNTEELRSIWMAKAHPYATSSGIDPERLGEDKNLKKIKASQKKKGELESDRKRERSEFEGNWHKRFWKKKEDGKPNYDAIAEAIFAHLDTQEVTVAAGEDRKKRNRQKGNADTGKGLIEKRAEAIASSANDPRRPKEASVDSEKQWGVSEVEKYFASGDLAATIFNSATADGKRNKPLNSSDFGQLIREHFKTVLDENEAFKETPDESEPEEHKKVRFRMWALHNAVRKFYGKLAKSERFRTAALIVHGFREKDEARIGREKAVLRQIVPTDKRELVRILNAKRKNADFSRYIRLGKLMAHASDVPLEVEVGKEVKVLLDDAALKDRIDYFVTSEGQNEIKRNEAFVRVWRNATGQSFQTLRTLTNRQGDLSELKKEIEPACLVLTDETKPATVEEFNQRLSIIFGDRKHEGKSRTSLFVADNAEGAQEVLWSLLGLAATVRHKTNHFMVKSRFLDLIQSGIVQQIDDDAHNNIGGRPSSRVNEAELQRFKALLEYDQGLLLQAKIDELKAIKADQFLETEKLENLVKQLIKLESDLRTPLPRFAATMRKAKTLQDRAKKTDKEQGWAEPLPGVTKLDLNSQSETSESNRCKVGLLRLLYDSGFQYWLKHEAPKAVDLKAWITSLIDAKEKRGIEMQEERKQAYTYAKAALDHLRLDTFDDVGDLFGAMVSAGTHENGNSRRYEPDRGEQQKLGQSVEAFKQEVVAKLFEEYLAQEKMEWIWDLPSDALVEPFVLTASLDIQLPARIAENNWASQFYTWLYLLPPGTVSDLRHQMRKSLVLEGKVWGKDDEESGNPNKEAYETLDYLMALYTRVQGTGFAGSELREVNANASLLYENEEQFAQVFSIENQKQEESISGTLRGLRLLERFGHVPVMQALYAAHKVSDGEVDKLRRTTPELRNAMFRAKSIRHKQIVEWKGRDRVERPEKDYLPELCQDYEGAVTQTTQHNFAVRAARLEDHMRAHKIMMRVVGKLTDCTLIWERDQTYCLLGMLYDQWREKGREDKIKVEVRLVEEVPTVSIPLGELGSGTDERLRLWSAADGFASFSPTFAKNLLDETRKELFVRHFPGAKESDTHPKDVARAKNGKSPPFKGRKQIRNDFAHYNVINRAGKDGPDLTALVNLVRSMFGYDRKLKKAVSGSIVKLLEREGIMLEWDFEHDRLVNPKTTPIFERHLDFVGKVKDMELPILIPRVSPRMLSMVQGLFGRDIGGNRAITEQDGQSQLCYPQGIDANVPGAIPQELKKSMILSKSGSDNGQ